MKEADIRPRDLFEEYLRQAEEDVRLNFKRGTYQFIACPACQAEACVFAFRKSGLTYEHCPECLTIFLNPRPDAATFDAYCQKGSFVDFWSSRMYKQTEPARRESIIGPRARMVADKIGRLIPLRSLSWLGDIGAGYGTFCEEAAKALPTSTAVFAIEPAAKFAAVCRSKGICVVEKYLKAITPDDFQGNGRKGPGALTCFDVLEHVQDPAGF